MHKTFYRIIIIYVSSSSKRKKSCFAYPCTYFCLLAENSYIETLEDQKNNDWKQKHQTNLLAMVT